MANKLYVGGLSYDTSEDALRQAFAEAGTVQSATIIMDRMTGRSKGFAFVEMASDDEAQKAIELLDGKTLDGRSLTVNIARPMQPRTGQGRGGRSSERSGFGGRERRQSW